VGDAAAAPEGDGAAGAAALAPHATTTGNDTPPPLAMRGCPGALQVRRADRTIRAQMDRPSDRDWARPSTA